MSESVAGQDPRVKIARAAMVEYDQKTTGQKYWTDMAATVIGALDRWAGAVLSGVRVSGVPGPGGQEAASVLVTRGFAAGVASADAGLSYSGPDVVWGLFDFGDLVGLFAVEADAHRELAARVEAGVSDGITERFEVVKLPVFLGENDGGRV